MATGDEIRDVACKKVAETLRAFTELPGDELGAAVAGSLLVFAGENGCSEQEVGKVMEFANEVQRMAVTLQFFLVGAMEIRIVDDELNFRAANGDNEEMVRQLVRSGIAITKST